MLETNAGAIVVSDLDIVAIDQQFEVLLDLSAQEREEELALIRAQQPERERILRKLLRISADAHTLDIRGVGESLRIEPEEALPPQIEGYQLVREIGRGGMATVFEAVRSVHGTQQSVAIKVLRSALLTAVDRDRFVTEQRILATLKHPNIATLLDVGVVNNRPYMVLERIDGVAINQHFTADVKSVPAILQAFLQVVDAVQCAHERFIVHRDIKPSNVLVDHVGHIKLIDFGIAKMLDDAATLRGESTLTGAMPMTLRYASPEQLKGRPVGVGSDIYQLGLLFYCLFSGVWPFDEAPNELPVERLRANFAPIPPSRRVTDPRLRRCLAGDIDSILLRCLRWDPVDRYRSAAELRDDIQCHMERRPVRARRHTQGYLLRNYIQRHRLGAVLALSILVIALVGQVTILVLGHKAHEYAARTERILDTVTEMFAISNPYIDNPGAVTVAEVVQRASAKFLGSPNADPVFHVAMLERLAQLQDSLGGHTEEVKLLQHALQIAYTHNLDRQLIESVTVALAEAMLTMGSLEEIENLIRHAESFSSENQIRANYVLARVRIEQARFDQAEKIFTGIFSDLADAEPTAIFKHSVYSDFASLQGHIGHWDKAIDAYQESLSFLETDQLEHQEILVSALLNLSVAYETAGRWQEAETEFRQVLAKVSQWRSGQHPQLANIARHYSQLMSKTSRFESAYLLLTGVNRSALAENHHSARASYLQELARQALWSGRPDAAVQAGLDALVIAADFWGNDAPNLYEFLVDIAWVALEADAMQMAADFSWEAVRRKPEAATRAEIILQLAAQSGTQMPGWPRVKFLDTLASECARLEYQVLRSLLVERKSWPSQAVPIDCDGIQGARLAALGLTWTPVWDNSFIREPMRSPLVQRWKASEGPKTLWKLSVDQRKSMQLALKRITQPSEHERSQLKTLPEK